MLFPAHRINPAAHVGYDADAAAWKAAVIGAGGTVGAQQAAYVNELVCALKAGGVWSSLDRLWLFASENPTQATIDLVGRATAMRAHTSSTNPSFVSNTGFLGNRDGYIDSGFNPATTGGSYAQNSASFGFYCYSAPTTPNDRFAGSDAASDTQEAVYATTNFTWALNGASLTGFPHNGNLIGLFQINRTASNASTINQNNVQKQTTAIASVSLVSRNIFVLAGNNAGSPILPIDAGLSLVFVGGGLSSAQLSAQYAAFRAYLTSMGVP